MNGVSQKSQITFEHYYKRNNYRYSHCEPEGRGNLVFAWDCFVAPLLAMTRCFCLKPLSSNLEPLGYQALLNLGIDLPAGETFELSAGRRTGGRTGSAPLANHFVDLADFRVLQVLNGLIGTYLEASLTAHTGLWIDSGCNGIAEHGLLRKEGHRTG